MEYVIEDNVPIPAKLGGKYCARRGISEALRNLKIGQSLFVKDSNGNKISKLATRISKETKYKFTCRNVEGGARAWRIE